MATAKTDNLFDGTQRQRKHKEGQKEVKLNPALAPPYAQEFPQLQKLHQRMILEEIETVLKKNITDQCMAKKRRKLIQKHPTHTLERTNEILLSIFSKRVEYSGRNLEELISSLNNPALIQNTKDLNKFVLVGVRAITRCVENQGDFSLIVCCSSGDRWCCQNILCIALLNNIPICGINGLSDAVSRIVSCNHVGAIGFKNVAENPFKDLVDFIIDKIPDVDPSWTRLWKVRKPIDKYYNSEDTCKKKRKLSTNEEAFTDTDERKVVNDIMGQRNEVEYLPMNVIWKENKKQTGVKKSSKASESKLVRK